MYFRFKSKSKNFSKEGRLCNKCGEFKKYENFHKRADLISYDSICKQCKSKNNKLKKENEKKIKQEAQAFCG